MSDATEEKTVPVDGARAAPPEPHRFAAFGCAATGLYDTDAAGNIDVYLGLKERCGRVLSNRAAFLDGLNGALAALAREGDVVVYPQSRKDLNADLVARIGLPSMMLRKRAKDEVIALAERLEWTRDAWASQRRRFAEMSANFDLHKIKSNQRHRYVPFLFDAAGLAVADQRVLLVDDSIFSGTTAHACVAALRDAGCADIRFAALFWCRSLVSRLAA